MKSKWMSLAKALIVLSAIVLFLNALSLFVEIRRDISYGSRSYGLSTMNDYFDDGDYQQVYLLSLKSKYADEELSVEVSQ